jgi:hypothetical protein
MFVILASNSSRKVAVVGTATGRTFKSEAAAERKVRSLRQALPGVDFLVLPISEAVV